MSHTFELSYIGWSPAKGLWGNEFVQPIFEHIIDCRATQNGFVPDVLKVSVRKNELNIIKEIPSRLAIRTYVDCPSIPLVDVSFSTKITLNKNVYVCILVLGYDPDTGEPVHLYVYQIRNDEEATRFVNYITKKTKSKEFKQRILRIEQMLVEDGKIRKSKLSTTITFNDNIFNVDLNCSNSSSNCSTMSEKFSQSKKHVAKNIKESPLSNAGVISELNHKLQKKQSLLLPPRDYDTIHRKHGNCNMIRRGNTLPNNHLPFSNM